MCTTCGNSGGGWCPCCTEEKHDAPIGFKCESCGEISEKLTLEDGYSVCDDCIAIHEEELQELINQTF